jgi:UDPglucose--hexose-1-phosphate uridylyltransferase
MHCVELTKPDGRALTLYARQPMRSTFTAPSPFAQPLAARAHLRWHPLRGEWVTYAAYPQDRTFLPPPEYNPLAPTVDRRNPTEVPAGDWDVAVFDNRFPSLGGSGHAELPEAIAASAPADGQCEVVVYAQDRDASLGALALDHIELLLQVWADRCRHLGARPEVQYVLPFENRGAEVAVTLHHPHGQIYAYPVVPPVAQRMQQQAAQHFAEHGRGVLETLIAAERRAAVRMLYDGPHAAAFVPVCARYPYEVWWRHTRPSRSSAICRRIKEPTWRAR